eukprot:scaffold116919_cov89-Cyclotella_meneghiniana.AAC.1
MNPKLRSTPKKLHYQEEIYRSFSADKSQIYDGRELGKLTDNLIVQTSTYGENENMHTSVAFSETGDIDPPSKGQKPKFPYDQGIRTGKPRRRHTVSSDTTYSSCISKHSRCEPISDANDKAHSCPASGDPPSSLNQPIRRRKSVPNHRDMETNFGLSGIMKAPKYSSASNPRQNVSRRGVSDLLGVFHLFNLEEELGPGSIQRTYSSRSGLTSLSPISVDQEEDTALSSSFHSRGLLQGLLQGKSGEQSARSSMTSASSVRVDEDWLPKGVEFCDTVELYVYNRLSS